MRPVDDFMVDSLLARADADMIERIGVRLVQRLAELAKSDPVAADRLALAVADTFASWRSNVSGSLSAAIEEAA